MLEINDEANLSKDDIKTKDGLDYKTNNGYILGTPFLHAFMVILDFEQNRLGFSKKVRGYGSEITGEGAPGPVRTDKDPKEPETNPTDPATNPTDTDTNPTDTDSTPSDPDTTPTDPDTTPTDPDNPPTDNDPKDPDSIIMDPMDGSSEHLDPNPYIPSDDKNPPKPNYIALFSFIAIVSLGGVCIFVGCRKSRKPKPMFAKTTEVR